MSGRGLFLTYPLSSALCSPADLPQTGRPAYPGTDVPFSGGSLSRHPSAVLPGSGRLALRVFSCP